MSAAPRALLTRARAATGLCVSTSPVLVGYFLALALVTGAVPVAIAWITGVLLDRLTGPTAGPVTWPVCGLAALSLTAVLTQQAERYTEAQLRRTTSAAAQDRLFAKVNAFTGLDRLESPRFFDQLRMAQQAGATAPQDLLEGSVSLIRSGMLLAGFLTALCALWPPIAVPAVLAALPVVYAELRMARTRADLTVSLSPTIRRRSFYQMLLTDRTAAQEIRLFGTGGFLSARMSDVTRRAMAAENSVDLRIARLHGLLGLVACVVTGAGLLAAADRARTGRLTPGDVVVFIAAVAGVQAGMAQLAAAGARGYQALLLFGSYQEVIGAADALTPGVLPPGRLRRGLEFRDVWFRYDEHSPWVLRGLSFTLRYGEATALVGQNGAGKSTVVKLLCRFYDPSCGQILWDGVDLRELDPALLRARVRAVFQEFVRYDLTAAENIGMGDLSALTDRTRITRAAALARADGPLAALPGGYDTMLSRIYDADPEARVRDTATLSGGQWQRVALARALMLDDPDLLILDEPSSGLDARAEHDIHTTLRTHRAGRTSLLISHRLNTLRDADKILVLDQGRITETGPHADLVAAGGTYAGLFAVQSAGYRDELTAEVG
ncbi:multidrug ABC transporter permease [Longispora fulva]|uniref:ATP-binding cassette subfamily B protein n=1 Tax=Longispora fulva TaxID=619741 RepID=A0A8J7GNS0_9ACTN|nr:ABC transporter ATP-binding protein [Longispora fulva]MBG6133996.1 ATP-binding cassette subfamily B protein [Longispora fulva]GIG63577.1 multidrug ABC transporter permease [Longispora fulva]